LSGRSTTAPIGPIEGYLVETTTWEVQEIKSNDEDEVPSHRWDHSAVVVGNRDIFLFVEVDFFSLILQTHHSLHITFDLQFFVFTFLHVSLILKC
jgi:hypothetical protein